MGNFDLNGGIPWITNTEDATCFACKQDVETVNHFLLECSGFKENLDSLWEKLKTKASHLHPVDGDQIVDFITNLDQHNKMLLLLRGLQLPFDDLTANSKKDLLLQLLEKFIRFAQKSCVSWGSMLN